MSYDDKLDSLLRAALNGILPGAALLVLLCAALGLGLMVLRASRRPSLGPFEVPLAMVLGLGIGGYVADLNYMAQGLPPLLMSRAVLACGLICLAINWRRARQLAGTETPWHWDGSTRLDRMAAVAGWAVVLLVIVKHYINTVVPITDNDSIVHYSFLSRLIATDVTFDDALLLRKMPITDLNRLVQHIYGFGHALAGEGGMHLVNLGFFGIVLLMLHRVCVYHFHLVPFWNPLPVLVPLTIFEIIATGYSGKLDYGVAMFEVAAMLAVVLRRQLPLWVLPVLFALSICARINSMRVVVVAGLVLLVDMVWQRVREGNVPVGQAARASLGETGAVALATGVLAAPPYAMNWLIYGNPLFPFFNGIFGAYTHWYDYVLFEHQRYYVNGIFGPPLVYLQLCTIRFWQFLEAGGSLGGRYGLGPIFLLAPFAVSLKRPLAIVYALFALGFLSWAVSANTHRTLLGVAFIGVPLIVSVFVRLRPWRAVYGAAFALVLAVAASTLYVRMELPYLAYFMGKIDADRFYEQDVRVENAQLLTPSLDDVAALRDVVGDQTVMSVNVVLQAHPALRRVLLIYLTDRPMEARLQDPALDPLDREIITRTLSSEYLRNAYHTFASHVFPSSGRRLPELRTRRDLWDFVRTYYDVHYFVQDALIEQPARILNLMRIQKTRFLATPPSAQEGSYRNIAGLRLVWHSSDIDLFEDVGTR